MKSNFSQIWCSHWPIFFFIFTDGRQSHHTCRIYDACGLHFDLQFPYICIHTLDYVMYICTRTYESIILNLCKKDVISLQPQITLAAIPSMWPRNDDKNRSRRIENKKKRRKEHIHANTQPLTQHSQSTAHVRIYVWIGFAQTELLINPRSRKQLCLNIIFSITFVYVCVCGSVRVRVFLLLLNYRAPSCGFYFISTQEIHQMSEFIYLPVRISAYLVV